ncbi:ribonuclease E/G [Acetobacter suratthaniensis]|uniref:Ribonuclease E n=1 Tax=Acetobacter suratthaniensis TaxID=1502841 RepID=A0ABS3LK08_9PROT|nr:ribonuclease E/G [Acetobacter suratthaniensis]MBO1327919.1 ribonuclease E/G [Acetobacter suratthaniensis]MCX2565901.1 ribonuclease E/G [Acetobacter suratthaniensis]
MSKRMLIDATHAEETRVVVMDGNRLEDYDVESAAKKQLKGNIYLARVIRVEPSLQAAFVEYGGNRHGFLAFSEIHPDYYQIPVADREQLLALQAEEENLLQNAEDEDEDAEAPTAEGAEAGEEGEDGAPSEQADAPEYVSGETDTGEEALIQKRIARFLRNYRIQEVIRRRQVMLVQVVKEERGNKGAALTTYVSLAGRYCVLMPNALRGGGVSRKITSVPDRKRLRDIISGLNLPRGMAMIVRTAGAQRPGPEITRDCEYLLHLWDDIRDHTLRSMAPALIYEEASLVKRAIRDVYTRDVSEIVVDGESGWKAARDFMRMLMPQHAEKVRLWNKENQPLFTHYQVEGHLDAMFSPVVSLRSGGYLVINQTEALVAIDVNSGKATSQRNIEETAFRTNQEAADEVARQLRLRDLAGLIVIDFIDMESRRHNTMIERRLKDALRNDRARIQIGSISHFGLLEMSRQRLRPSVAEAAFVSCPHCNGTGVTRSVESSALHVLRSVEEEGARRRASAITVHVAADIAFYILNNKRDWLGQIEQRHQMEVLFSPDATLPVPEIRIERRQSARHPVAPQAPQLAPVENVEVDEPTTEDSLPTTQAAQPAAQQAQQPRQHEAGDTAQGEAGAQGEDEPRRRRRRRRRRRGGGGENAQGSNAADATQQTESDSEDDADDGQDTAPDHETAAPRTTADATDGGHANLVPGRRRTRHTRVRRDENEQQPAAQTIAIEEGAAPQPRRPVWNGPTPANPFGGEPDIFELLENSVQRHNAAPRQAQPERKVDTVPAPAETVKEAPAPVTPEAEAPAPADEATQAKPARRTRRRTAAKTGTDETVQAEAEATEAEAKPTRRRTRKSTAKTEAEAPAEAAAQATPADDSAEAPAAKPARRRTRKSAAADQAPEAEAATPVVDAENTKAEPLVQPITIEDSPPAARRRTGWWKR